MDIQYQTTPPKRTKRAELFSTPPNHKTTPNDTQTPKKSRVTFQSPTRDYDHTSRDNDNSAMTTPTKRNYQASKKKTKHSSGQPTTPRKSHRSPADQLIQENSIQNQMQVITPFSLPRIESDYKFIRYLGQGNFSRVALYQSRLTSQQFAIKSTQLSLMSVNQVQALGTLSSMFAQNSRHIVKYYHSWIEQQRIYIVMEYCQSAVKEVYQLMKMEGRIIAQEKLKQMMKQALIGLRAMHECNMVHLDIKPDNLLIKQGEIKIADLGLCRITRIKRWSDLDQGDTRYLAKEVLNYHQGIDLTKADIYSLGMSIFQGAILQDLPNNGEHWLSIRQNGINFKEIPQMQNYSQQFQEIIAQMIHPHWQNRPSCQQLLNHKYFAEVKNKRLSRFLRVSGRSARKQEGSL